MEEKQVFPKNPEQLEWSMDDIVDYVNHTQNEFIIQIELEDSHEKES